AALKARQARLRAETSEEDFVLDPDIAARHPDIAKGEENLHRARRNELQAALGIIEDEIREAEANLAEVRASIDKYSRSRSLLQKELEITRKLVRQRAVPEIERIRLERELNEAAGNLATAAKSRESLEARVAAARKRTQERKSAFRSQALDELSEVESRLAAIGESLKSAEDRVRRTELRSPVDGVVHRLHVKTVGGVIQPAQKLV